MVRCPTLHHAPRARYRWAVSAPTTHGEDMSKRSKTRRRKANPLKADLRAVAGLERARHFAEGGSPVTYRGGRMWTQADGRAVARKTACRGKVDY